MPGSIPNFWLYSWAASKNFESLQMLLYGMRKSIHLEVMGEENSPRRGPQGQKNPLFILISEKMRKHLKWCFAMHNDKCRTGAVWITGREDRARRQTDMKAPLLLSLTGVEPHETNRNIYKITNSCIWSVRFASPFSSKVWVVAETTAWSPPDACNFQPPTSLPTVRTDHVP